MAGEATPLGAGTLLHPLRLRPGPAELILLAVNYHYVAAERRGSPRAIFPILPDELGAQVEALARSFELLSRDELVRGLESPGSLPERGCVITFDDGLREQYELALPVLERLGAPAVFFVCGRPLRERLAVEVHKLHHLREELDEATFAAHLHTALEDEPVPDVPDDEARSMYRYDSPEAARVKYLLNVLLPAEVRVRVVGRIFDEVVGDESAFCDRLYLGREQVADLEHRLGAVGAHGYAHEPMSTLDDAALADDLEQGIRVLEDVTSRRPRVLSYPYGSAQAVDRRVADRAREAGFAAAFTMERAANRTPADPLLLARIDTNDAPGGKTPQLELDEGDVVFREGVSPARTRYFVESAGEPARDHR